jgi:hypothetical protein
MERIPDKDDGDDGEEEGEAEEGCRDIEILVFPGLLLFPLYTLCRVFLSETPLLLDHNPISIYIGITSI